MSRSRLLTLTGPGGIGKTRLALAAAGAASASYPGGVCWVELAPLDDPGIVALVVARQLGVPDCLGRDAAAAIAEHVGDRSILIVLDNCEHVPRCWQAPDGSAVTGQVVTKNANGAGNIAELNLDATQIGTSTGLLAHAVEVLRLNTLGGVAPTGSCDPQATPIVSVPYRADYVFING